MTAYLTFQLYGAMASWGEVAVGERRGTAARPTRSAVLGLVAAALGLRREQREELMALEGGYGVAVAVLRAGVPLRDYHTAQAPQVAARSRLIPGPRATNMKAASSINTILSERDYRCDAFYQVALWAREGARWPLEALADALERPVFALWLGRKSCPLALPLRPELLDAQDLTQLFHAAQANLEALEAPREGEPRRRVSLTVLESLRGESRWSVGWDLDGEAGVEALREVKRRDRLVSRDRWHFGERLEREGSMPDKE